MKNYSILFLFFISFLAYGQIDYSNSWEDFFSYNNVKEVIASETVLYALTDNAVFTYDIETEQIQKISSINGLSGEETSSFFYDEDTNRLIIGYDNGLLEIIGKDGGIIVAPDILNFNQTGLKSINNIYKFENKLYLSTAFAIVVYDIENLEFGDTYFIGSGSSDVFVNQITVLNNEIYAATNNGIYVADATATNLIDASNWNLRFVGNYQQITQFNNVIYAVSNQVVSRVSNNVLTQVLSYTEAIKDIKASNDRFIVSLENSALHYNSSLVLIEENTNTSELDFTLNTAIIHEGITILATEEFGVLLTSSSNTLYKEIHPEGPMSNNIFSIDTFNDNLWIVYGGYDITYTPLKNKQGYTHYNGGTWLNVPYDSDDPYGDLVSVTIDETAENRVFISSFGDTNSINTKLTGGLYEIENDELKMFYNNTNSELEDIVKSNAGRVTVRVSETILDKEGSLWVTNVETDFKLKKLTSSGEWFNYDISSLYVNNVPGMSEIVQDNSNSLWIGSRGNGVFVYNENGDQKKALTTEVNKGNLPNARIESIAIDDSNNVWIGTVNGLVLFSNPESIFDVDAYNAEPVVISQDGVAERLLGDQNVKTIEVDGANNKWFGTDGGGVVNTNPTGQTTLATFNTKNSPLPSDNILKISVDDSTGKVFIVTDKGMVAYNSNVAPFGDELGEVYAYPNPVLKNHDTVTIDGRNGTHLPENTNVKIVDVAGNLVYETNVVEGEQLQGGKVVWNKRNLAGTKVASGIYIVFLITEDGSEHITTKIAIIN